MPHTRERATGFRDGLLVAGVILMLALGGGIVSLPGLSPAPSPTPAATVRSTPGATVPSPTPTIMPAVTPANECYRDGAAYLPRATLLFLKGNSSVGARTAVEPVGFPSGAPTADPGRIPWIWAESGAAAEIDLEGGYCATGWRIQLGDDVLDEQRNPQRDPAYAAQNVFRFRPSTAMGGDLLLTALLEFEHGDETIQWQLELDPPTLPSVYTESDGGTAFPRGDTATLVPGCNLTFAFPEGSPGEATCASDPPPGALPEIVASAGSAVIVSATDRMQLAPETEPNTFICGHLTGEPSVLVADDACVLGYAPLGPSAFGFRAPGLPGRWDVAAHFCIDTHQALICGTWYGTLVVTPQPR